MLKKRWLFALIVLVFASLACSLVTGSGKKPVSPTSGGQSVGGVKATASHSTEVPPPTKDIAEPSQSVPVATETQPGSVDKKYNTEFPLPDDVSMFTDMGNGTINFQTGLSQKDALAFYREAFNKAGYTEREINTNITDTTFSLVFEGHSSGKLIVIQSVDLGNGRININIRFEAN
jgi:hypothetical protein